MRRRELVAALFASSLPMPLAAQSRAGRIGYLALLQNERLFNALVRGLEDQGHVLNANVVIEARSAEGDPARLEEAAAALVAQKPDLIVAVGNAATRAARRAAGAIPIVFAPSGDAVTTGMVASLARPGGNLTGLSLDSWILNEKRLEALRDNFPGVKRVAVLANFGNPSGEAQWKMTERGAAVLGFEVVLVEITRRSELETALSQVAATGSQAMHVLSDSVFDAARNQIVSFASAERMLAIYEHRAFPEAGGLMSYGPNLDRISARAATYVDKILKGTPPADLPVEQPTHLELVINLKTAKEMGIFVPPALLIRADEVIE
jgi:putative tryptophan/tyrosine transport system substrate-binding protein